MAIEGMNHFNVLTDDVDATRRFYVGILGFERVTRFAEDVTAASHAPSRAGR